MKSFSAETKWHVCHFGSRQAFCLPSLATLACLIADCKMTLTKTRVAPTDITKGFKSVLLRASTEDKFANFLKDSKLWNPQDVVLLCNSDESWIEKKLLNPYKTYLGKNVAEDLAPDVEVSIRRAWRYCKEMLSENNDDVDAIDPVEAQSIDQCWGHIYGVKLTPDERVGPSLMKKLHTMVHKCPVEFEIVTLEQVTISSVTTKQP